MIPRPSPADRRARFPVRDRVWEIYRDILGRIGPVPTLIEWDNDVPDWATLLGEARRAQRVRAGTRCLFREEALRRAV
jgi:uncharacterized protein (UPF0276 family)